MELKEETKFVIKGIEYPVPDLTFRQYRAALKVIDELAKKREESGIKPESVGEEIANLDEVGDFYFALMKEEHLELTREDFSEMPLHQYGMEFFIKLKLALFQAPLEKPKEEASSSESS